MFFEQYPDAEQAEHEVASFFDEAAPELSPGLASRVSGITVLATPPGPAGETFRELVRRVRPEEELHEAAGADDILLYRELSHLALSDLEQLGPQAQDAYRQMNAADNFTPHARIDVSFGPARG
jgi:hypothetical protein